MKRGSWLYAVCIMAGVGIGVVVSGRSGDRASDAAPDIASRQTSTVVGSSAKSGAADDQRALRSRLERLERELELLRSAGASAADRPSAPTEPLPETPHKDSALRVAEQIEVLSSALRAQPRDVGWARQTESHVTEVLRSAEFAADNKIMQLDCRQSLCTLEVEHATAEASELLPMQLPLALPEFGATWTTLKKDGDGLRSILYLSRKGARLPDLEDPDERASAASARR